ncbi:MAG: hypothetical protein GY937_23940 [bacterium]|nr:hypothetical protein [bacterium]
MVERNPPLTPKRAKLLILKSLVEDRGLHSHKSSVLGRMFSGGQGTIAAHIGDLSREEFGLANRCWVEMLAEGLIEPSGHDAMDPDNWCWPTEAGRAALARGLADDLDDALASLGADLPGLRERAQELRWASHPDPREIAGCLVELVDQSLRAGAPEQPDRRRKARAIAEARGAATEDLDDIAASLVQTQKRLQGEKHRPVASIPGRTKAELLAAAEGVLRDILLP